MKKEWTGERLETFVYNENMVEHLHRYSIAMSFITGKKVLDIASGEGYGTNLLAAKAEYIFGVDIDNIAIEAAKKKYAAGNISFLQGSADKIPLTDNSVDVVVSFETIEHHDKHDEMLQEIKRVLKPHGLLIMSSPDKKHYTDETGYHNKFHIKELYFGEFKSLICSYFKNTFFLNQRFLAGSVILSKSGQENFELYSGDYSILNAPVKFTPVYNLVIASDATIQEPPSSVFTTDQWLDIIIKEISQKFTSSATWNIGRVMIAPLIFVKHLFTKN